MNVVRQEHINLLPLSEAPLPAYSLFMLMCLSILTLKAELISNLCCDLAMS